MTLYLAFGFEPGPVLRLRKLTVPHHWICCVAQADANSKFSLDIEPHEPYAQSKEDLTLWQRKYLNPLVPVSI